MDDRNIFDSTLETISYVSIRNMKIVESKLNCQHCEHTPIHTDATDVPHYTSDRKVEALLATRKEQKLS